MAARHTHLFARARLGRAARPRRIRRPPAARVGRQRARERREKVALVRLVELGGVDQPIDLLAASEP